MALSMSTGTFAGCNILMAKCLKHGKESARPDGKPRIVHQASLGSGEKVADLIKNIAHGGG
jgi:hypothetical protein